MVVALDPGWHPPPTLQYQPPKTSNPGGSEGGGLGGVGGGGPLVTRRMPRGPGGGGPPPPETDDLGRERALREGDPPPLPKRETDVFEGPGEGSGVPGDPKSRVHPSKVMTCPQNATWSRLLHRWTSLTFLRSAGGPLMTILIEVTPDVLHPPATPSPRARRMLSGSQEGTPLTLPGARRMILDPLAPGGGPPPPWRGRNTPREWTCNRESRGAGGNLARPK